MKYDLFINNEAVGGAESFASINPYTGAAWAEVVTKFGDRTTRVRAVGLGGDPMA